MHFFLVQSIRAVGTKSTRKRNNVLFQPVEMLAVIFGTKHRTKKECVPIARGNNKMKAAND